MNEEINMLEEELAEFILEPIRVVIEYIGEGRSGDYWEEDPDDYPHARFSVYRRPTEQEKSTILGPGEKWVGVDDASYCTTVDARTDKTKLRKFAQDLATEFHDPVVSGHSVKRLGEELSWWGVED